MKSKQVKQTELRLIPKDWKIRRLGDCSKLVKKQFKPSRRDKRRYVGLEHIGQRSLQLIEIGSTEDIQSNKFEFESGQILFGKLRPYFRKVYRPKFDGVCSTDIWVIDTKGQNDQSFFFYFFADDRIITEANNSSDGTRMPRAKWDYLEKLEFPIPSLKEQQSIAKILSNLDSKIELNQKMNKTLEQIAQTIFKSWFVDFDGQTEFVDSELGKIPKGWIIKELDKIAIFVNGLPLQKFRPTTNNYLPVIKIREMKNGFSDNTEKATVNYTPLAYNSAHPYPDTRLGCVLFQRYHL